jgi:hypothetical protein
MAWLPCPAGAAITAMAKYDHHAVCASPRLAPAWHVPGPRLLPQYLLPGNPPLCVHEVKPVPQDVAADVGIPLPAVHAAASHKSSEHAGAAPWAWRWVVC